MVVGERCRGDAETLSPHEDAVDTARGKIERRTALPGMATSYPAVAAALSPQLVLVSLLFLFPTKGCINFIPLLPRTLLVLLLFVLALRTRTLSTVI